ncbi:MAG: rhodanese-related sulfurtransferase [Marinovum sp.]|nr:rhodanese-related sulfurtransferase [Marinovum sp.]
MFVVAALYKFTSFPDPAVIRDRLHEVGQACGITGTLLVAHEGINGTVAGTSQGIDRILNEIRSLPGCDPMDHKLSTAETQPFAHLKVRVKREIVTMGQPGIDPKNSVGTYVTPQDWNALIEKPDVVVIDTRNDYEVAIGTFEGALDPKTKSFSNFPEWWEQNKDKFHNKRVAMFCTGGIRCEKSTSFLKSKGVEDVYHLQGGILKYLEEVPEDQSRWNGSCFVFDGRVSVEHGLREGAHILCHACRRPLRPQDTERKEYEKGVSCHQCIDQTSDNDKDRFRERQKQIDLARARDLKHMGGHRGV